MITDASITNVAALLADPTRVAMLLALADGRIRPAGELARCAGVSASTASEHLARLLAGGLVVAERHGRHRYYRVRGGDVVETLEALGAMARPSVAATEREAGADRAIHHARACYDHLAGALGVQVTQALVERGVLVATGPGYDVPPEREALLSEQLGVNVERARASRRHFAKACLDWTERTHHVAGALGAELLERFLALGWLERHDRSRALRVTSPGRRGFRKVLGVDALSTRYAPR